MVITASWNSNQSQVQMQLRSQAQMEPGAGKRPASSPSPRLESASLGRLLRLVAGCFSSGWERGCCQFPWFMFSVEAVRDLLFALRCWVPENSNQGRVTCCSTWLLLQKLGRGGWKEGGLGRQNNLFRALGSQGCLHKVPQIGSLNVGNVLSHGSRSWRFRIKVLAAFLLKKLSLFLAFLPISSSLIAISSYLWLVEASPTITLSWLCVGALV